MATEKRAFRAPATGDPREIELAFEYLNTKINEIVTSIDAAFGTQETDASAENAEVKATAEANTPLIAANAASLSTNQTAQTAAITASTSTMETDYDGQLATCLDIQACADSGIATTYRYPLFITGADTTDINEGNDGASSIGYNETLKPDIDDDLSEFQSRIATLETKINAICAIIRND